MPRDMCQNLIINGMPHAGEVDDQFLEGDIDTDLIKKIRENKYDYIRMSSNWTDDDKEFDPWYIEFQNWDNRNLAQSNKDTIEDPNDFDICKYIQDNHTGIILATPPGVFSPYYAENQEKNEELNPLWDTNVKKYFPDQWEGHGGDPDVFCRVLELVMGANANGSRAVLPTALPVQRFISQKWFLVKR